MLRLQKKMEQIEYAAAEEASTTAQQVIETREHDKRGQHWK